MWNDTKNDEISSSTFRIPHSAFRINKLVFGGYGICFHEGKTYFVQNAFPGDVITPKILYKKKDSYFCEIEKIITPSPYRSQTRCEVSDKCGACDWVNIDYAHQIDFKTSIYNEIFDKSKIDCHPTLTITASPQIDHYRNKAFFPVATPTTEDRTPNTENRTPNTLCGMYARQTHEIIEHKTCYLNPPIYTDIIRTIKDWIIAAKVQPYNELTHTGDLRHIGIRSQCPVASSQYPDIIVILVTRRSKLPFTQQLINSLTTKYPQITGIIQNIQPDQTNTILSENDKILYGKPFLHQQIGHIKYQIHYKAFFQINTPQAENIYNQIASFIEPTDTVIDAYSGVGCIGLYIAQKAKKVICIESNKDAVESANTNANINNIHNIDFINAETEQVLKEQTSLPLTPSTIIFDPPRKGLDKSIIQAITKHKIPKIIYLSCNPTTQKRDIELFLENGYKLTYLQGFDMFPHTYHIESLAKLEI